MSLSFVVPHQSATFGPASYVSQYRQQYRHITSPGLKRPKEGPKLRFGHESSTLFRPKIFDRLLRMARRLSDRKPSAGQASSPQLSVKDNNPRQRPSPVPSSPNDVKYAGLSSDYRSHSSRFRDFCDTPRYRGSSVTGSSSTTSDPESCSTTPEPDWPQESALDRKRKQLVDAGMVVFKQAFHELLEHELGQIISNSPAQKGTKGSANSGDQLSKPQSREPMSGSWKRQVSKSGNDNGADDEDDEDDTGNRKNGDSNTSRHAEVTPKKLACPYLKHDPNSIPKIRKWLVCRGSSWDTAHRTKEHLMRVHKVPDFSCQRCYEKLKDAKALETHAQAEVACSRNPINAHIGFDKGTEDRLKERLRGTETEKWKRLYEIVFPGEPVPSPFKEEEDDDDDGTTHNLSKKRRSRDDDIDEFLQRCEKQARKTLEQDVAKQLSCVEEHIKNTAIEVVGVMREEIVKFLEERRRRASPEPLFPTPQQQDLLSATTYNDPFDFSNPAYTHVLDPNTYSIQNILGSDHAAYDFSFQDGQYDQSYNIM